jgi:membrane protease subunit HflC
LSKRTNLILAVIILVAIFVISGGTYVVDEREQVVITQFGEPKGEPKKEAGLKFKIPLIQKVNRFPKQLLEWDGDPGQIPTLDKTFIWVDTFARWRIDDPLKYMQNVGKETWAQNKLDEIIDPAVRNAITSHELIETVRNSNRSKEELEEAVEEDVARRQLLLPIRVGREKIDQTIEQQAARKLAEFGIELMDVRIKRVNYVEEVRKSVYDRMIEERNSIAERIRSEGEEQAKIIEGAVKKQLAEITSKAYKEAQRIKGEADGEAARIYAEAYNEDPEFYAFLKSLEVYSAVLDENSQLILDTQTDLWQYIKRLKPAPASVSP